MFTATLFGIAKCWKFSTGHSTGEWLESTLQPSTGLLGNKKDEPFIHATTCRDLKSKLKFNF